MKSALDFKAKVDPLVNVLCVLPYSAYVKEKGDFLVSVIERRRGIGKISKAKESEMFDDLLWSDQ